MHPWASYLDLILENTTASAKAARILYSITTLYQLSNYVGKNAAIANDLSS